MWLREGKEVLNMSSSSSSDVYDVPGGLSKRHGEHNGYGIRAQNRIRNAPETEIVHHLHYKDNRYMALLVSLGMLENRTILEVGCGTGYFAIYLARQGANVFGCDIAFEAVKATHQRAKLNKVDGSYIKVNMAYPLPFASESFDIVVGVDVCHHLTRPDVLNVLNESFRVLRRGGKAIFVEPVEDSMIFSFIQNLFPSGKKDSRDYRPTCLSRRAYLDYLRKADDRSLTSRELIEAGQRFKSVRLRQFGLFNRLEGLFEFIGVQSTRLNQLLQSMDHYILKYCAPMRRFCRNVVIEYLK